MLLIAFRRYLPQTAVGRNEAGEIWMDSRTGWIISLTIVVCFLYLYATSRHAAMDLRQS